ncbi:MAG: carbohydrate ABC transporter permease [Chloroflexi bacterium]|nr:carbohydrate ABC transporter permease [Chloroflexota bacterium]
MSLTRRSSFPPASQSRQRVIGNIATYIACGIITVVFIFPTLWMISTSFKDVAQVYQIPMSWLPDPVMWDNYGNALDAMPFFNYVRNSLFIVIGSTFGTLLSCSLVAYGFARFRAPGKDVLFLIVLSTMMLPYAVTMIPQFVMFSTLGWVNTFNPLIVPAFFGSPFFIFLLRQFFLTIPRDLDEAAKMDGASALGIWFKIILPLAKPALVTVAVFSIIWTWNDYLGPLIYLSGKDSYTVAVGLAFFQGEHSTDWGMLMAASTMAVIPSLIIFLLAQKYFVQGIATSGLKG